MTGVSIVEAADGAFLRTAGFLTGFTSVETGFTALGAAAFFFAGSAFSAVVFFAAAGLEAFAALGFFSVTDIYSLSVERLLDLGSRARRLDFTDASSSR